MGLYDTAQANAPGQTTSPVNYNAAPKNLWTDDLKREYNTQQGMMYGNASFTPELIKANNAKWLAEYGDYPTAAQPAATAATPAQVYQSPAPAVTATAPAIAQPAYQTPAPATAPAYQPPPAPLLEKPIYKGLMDGDYDKLQSALAVGGQTAATDAYNTGIQNLTNTMSGRGLYGSSIMQQQQTQGLDREYQNASATNAANAASQRYAMQQADYKNAADTATNVYGINSTANTAANSLAGQISMNNANNSTQRYGYDSTAGTAANALAGQIGMNNANNATQTYGYNTAANTAANGLLSNQLISANNLAGQIGMNTADNFAKNYGVDSTAASAKYGYDTQAKSSLLHDASIAQTAANTNTTNIASIQAQVDAANKAGNTALALSIAKGAGFLLGADGKTIVSNLGNIGSAISNGASSLYDWGSGMLSGDGSYDPGTIDSSYYGDGQLWD